MSKPIVVRINGVEVETRIDAHGVQRLPEAPALAELFECGALDLSRLAVAVKRDGTCSEETRRWVYLRLGYSVCGYAACFPNDRIENPLWEESK